MDTRVISTGQYIHTGRRKGGREGRERGIKRGREGKEGWRGEEREREERKVEITVFQLIDCYYNLNRYTTGANTKGKGETN